MALFLMPSALTRQPTGRFRPALRAAAVLLALTMMQQASPALAQTGQDPRCEGIVPAPLPSTGNRIPFSYPSKVRFVNDSDWDISIRQSTTSGSTRDQVLYKGSSIDLVTATGTNWAWDTINNPYAGIRGLAQVTQAASQCFVLTRRAPPQPPLNPDPRCGGLVDAADPYTNLRVVNTSDKPIRFNLHGLDSRSVYKHDPNSKVVSGVTIPGGGTWDMPVRLFTDMIWDTRAYIGALSRIVVDRRGAHCLLLPGENVAATPGPTAQLTPERPVSPVRPAPVRPVIPVRPVPVRPAPPVRPTSVRPAPVRPAPVAPVTPVRPAIPAASPVAPVLAAGPSAPTLPPPDTNHEPCSQQDLITLVREGEKSGTITLDGKCRYQLTTPGDDWSGGTGLFISKATRLNGNGAIIERLPTAAKPFRLLGVNVDAGITIDNLTLRGGSVTGDGAALYILKPAVLRNVTFEYNVATAVEEIGPDGKTVIRAGGLGGAVRISNAEVFIDNARFFGNTGERGGAILASTPTDSAKSNTLSITNSVFANNKAISLEGAAVYLNGKTKAWITASTITDNSGNTGSAVESRAESLSVQSTILAWHSIAIISHVKGAFEDFNLFTNTGAAANATGGFEIGRGGNSRTTSNPRFIDPDRLDYAIDRYSPAVDRGAPGSAPKTDITGAPRPFTGTMPDIGAFEVQAQGSIALTIEKSGPFMITPDKEVQFTLILMNDGVRAASGLAIDDLLPRGATYVAGSASDGGNLSDGRIRWSVGTLNPGERRSVTYRVRATETLVSRDYGVTSADDPPAGIRGRIVETPLKKKLLTHTQFLPRPDGFSFSNFSDSSESDISDKDLEWIFGAAACKARDPKNPTAECVLRANVKTWRTAEIEGNKNGHCAGMAMTSLDIFANPELSPSTLQPKALTTFDIEKRYARNRISIYAATQVLTPVNWSVLQDNGTTRDPAQKKQSDGTTLSNPVEIVNTLIANLKDPKATDRYRISFSLAGGLGKGHTVVPFAVEEDSAGTYLIYVYENNRPNNFNMVITVDPRTGVWKYVAQTNPAQPLEDYTGNGSEDNLGLTSWRWSTSFPMCVPGDECPDPNKDKKIATVAPKGGPAVSVALSGEGYPLVTRSDGKRAGFDPVTGNWFSEIEGAQALAVSYALSSNVPPVIQIPYMEGLAYSVSIAGAAPTSGLSRPASLRVSGPDFAATVSGLSLWDDTGNSDVPASGQPVVTLAADPDSNTLSLYSNDGRPQAVTLGLAVSQTEGSDFVLTLRDLDLTKGQVGFGFDTVTQSVTMENDTGNERIYGLEIDRLNTDGSTDSFRGEVSDAGGTGIALGLGTDWTGSGTPPAIASQDATQPEAGAEVPAQDGSIVLQSVNYTDRYLAVAADGLSVEILPVTTASDPALLLRSRFLVVPTPDLGEDVAYLAVNDDSGRYIVATEEGVSLQSNGGGGMAAFFHVVPGLAGQGVSFMPLEAPGSYIRHSGFVLRLDADDGSDLFRQDASFLPSPAFAQ